MDMQPTDRWRARLQAASEHVKQRYLSIYGVPITNLRFHGRRWRFKARQRAKFISKRAPWSSIRVIGNSPAVRVAAAIPFVGYIILLNDKLSGFLAVHPEYSVFSPGTPWNLLLLYFGSFLTGLGAIVYSWRCPAFLKRYAIFADYRAAERDLWRNPAFAQRKWDEIDAEIRRDITDGIYPGVISSRNQRPYSDLKALSDDPEKVDDYLFREWEVMDASRPMARIATIVLYGAGLALLAGPSLLTFWKVVRFTFRAMW